MKRKGHFLMEKKDTLHLLTIEQAKHLLSTAQDDPLNALVTIALTTGLRRGELLGLRWQDIDIEDRILYVYRIVSWSGKIEATKAARAIPLPRIVVHVLKEHKKYQEEMRKSAGEVWQDLGVVFPNECGYYLAPNKLRRQYHALCVAAELPHLHFHDLRHNTAALLLRMGADIVAVQTILGLRLSSTPFKTLTPISLSMLRDAIEKWDALLEA